MVQPASSGLTGTPSLAWKENGPYMDEWVPVSVSHSASATTSSSSSSSSSSSLSVSSPHSRARSFCCFFLLSSSFAFYCRSAVARLAATPNLCFGGRARQSIKTSFFGWSRYPNVCTKGSEVQLKRRHGERELMKSMYPDSGRIGGCLSTGYTKSRAVPALSFKGSIAFLMRCATSKGGSAPSASAITTSDALDAIRCRGSARHQQRHPPHVVGADDP